jgi:XapX domain-containing protein
MRNNNKSTSSLFLSMNAQAVGLAFLTGFIVGAVFRLLHLPIPAPETLEGIMGIVGIFVGYVLLKALGI